MTPTADVAPNACVLSSVTMRYRIGLALGYTNCATPAALARTRWNVCQRVGTVFVAIINR